MHEILVDRLGGLGLPRKSVVRLTDRLDMTLDVYRGRKTKQQQQQLNNPFPDNKGPLSRQVYLRPIPRILYNGIHPRPRQTLKIGPFLVARPYLHLHSKCKPSPLRGKFLYTLRLY